MRKQDSSLTQYKLLCETLGLTITDAGKLTQPLLPPATARHYAQGDRPTPELVIIQLQDWFVRVAEVAAAFERHEPAEAWPRIQKADLPPILHRAALRRYYEGRAMAESTTRRNKKSEKK